LNPYRANGVPRFRPRAAAP